MSTRTRSIWLVTAAALLWAGCAPLRQCAYETGRDDWQQPERVVEALEIQPGQVVADLGSGSGYFTSRLAHAVGPQGRVYATDIDASINELLRDRLAEAGVENVEIVLAKPDDPLLPDGEIDLVFSSDTYHHMQDRPAYFRRLRADLAPGGRVAILEFDGSRGWFVRWFEHYTSRDQLIREMQEAGYRVEREHDFLDRQAFVVFAPE
jgi:ubiquinone/menaquinone biosynthesis C-methylase UbiE